MKTFFFQMVRFGVVGASNMVLDTLIYTGLTRWFDFFGEYYLLAGLIAFLISATNSFFWNKHWSFQDKAKFSHKQLVSFYFAAGVALSVNLGMLWLLVSQFEVFDITAKLIASLSAGGINFSMQKFWIFRQKADHDPVDDQPSEEAAEESSETI